MIDPAPSGLKRYDCDRLSAYASAVLERLDVPAQDAFTVAECLVYADLRGIGSHGLLRLPLYAQRLQSRAVAAHPSIRIETVGTAVGLVDGDNGLGAVVGSRAVEKAVELAEACGVGYVGVRRSNHFGAAAYYVEKAIAKGCIGIALTNAPPNMAPFGGRQRFLGTNPVAIGTPAGRERPLIFDASTALVARGKITLAAQKNEPIPDGWAIDPEGRPTNDAALGLAGASLPFAGYKGSGLSFVFDILCGVLTGAAFAVHLNKLEDVTTQQNIGHFFLAIRTDLFLPREEFLQRVDETIGLLRACQPAAGVERVLLPGEIELDNEARNRSLGIPFDPEVAAELETLGREWRAPFPKPV